MKKRFACLVLALAMIVSAMCITSTTSAISDADFVAPEILIPDYLALPDNDLLTDDSSFILAEGTRWEQTVTTDFIVEGKANRPGSINQMKYIVVHNTGSYPASSDAAANHRYGRDTDASVSWHYTCGNDGIYQMLPVNEKGWHAGGNYWNDSIIGDKVTDGSNSTGIGIETAVDGFPADAAFSGEHWDSEEMYEWYETHFDKTATYLAILVAYISVKLNFNPYTQTITHYQTAGKNCPMQMRYVFGTNTSFKIDGTYFKVFLDRMHDYYKAFGGTYESTDTCKNVYYNPDYKTYETGLYKANTAATVYRAGNTATGSVGTVATGQVVDVTITGWNWGKVTLSDGTTGWVDLTSFAYVTGDYSYGTHRTTDGTIVNVTAIDGTTATYDGGTADISTLTRVYKVEVEGDTTFGSEPKYYAEGETFTVTAVDAVAPMLFDIWETTYGIAKFEDKAASTTTVTVLNSDIVITSSYRDKYDLTVESGTGAGRYAVGDEVTVTARAIIGKTFATWAIESGEGTFADPTAFSTTFTMGAADTKIYAIYENATAFDLTGLTNYALNKSYIFNWRGVTGSEIAWYNQYFQQDVNNTILTDGVCEDDNSYTADNKFAAVTGTNQPGEITVDLGKAYEISRIVFRDFVIQSSWGDIQDFSVTYSLDGENYEPVQNFADTLYHSFKVNPDGSTTKISETLYTHCVDFVSANARFIKLSFKSSKYVTAFTEFEVYGASGQDATDEPTPPVSSEDEPVPPVSSEDEPVVPPVSSEDEPVPPVSSEDEPTVEATYGDVNGDTVIDSLDAAQTLKYDAMLVELTEDALVAADVNGDGIVDSLDAAQILKYDAMLIDSFPIEQAE